MVIWLIGLAGAGKTTIGREVVALLKERKSNVVFIDGDDFRTIMGDDLGHTIAAREMNAGRISRLCKHLDSQGIDVVCSVLSIFHQWQRWNRSNFSRYFEVYIRVPFETVVARDPKGLYKRALAGEITDVVGVDIEFPPPEFPNLVIDNDGPLESLTEIARNIVDKVQWVKGPEPLGLTKESAETVTGPEEPSGQRRGDLRG